MDAPTLVIDRDQWGEAGVEGVDGADERPHGRWIPGVLTEERDARHWDVRVKAARFGIEHRTGQAAQEQARNGVAERWHRQAITSAVTRPQIGYRASAVGSRITAFSTLGADAW